MSLLVLAAGCCGILNKLPRTLLKPPARSHATRIHRRLLHTATPPLSSRQTDMKASSDDASDPRKLMPLRTYADDLREKPNVEYTIRPIGFVKSPYKERFGTPRQATVETQILGGTPQEGELVLDASIAKTSLRGLDGFDYCWVMSWMHLNTGYKPLITPPRLRMGRKKGSVPRVGLFATRAPHRPNQIALSALRIVSVCEKSGVVRVRGLDLIDGTPIIDIKPYVPYCDAFPDAASGWVGTLPQANGPDYVRYSPPPKHLICEESVPEEASSSEDSPRAQ